MKLTVLKLPIVLVAVTLNAVVLVLFLWRFHRPDEFFLVARNSDGDLAVLTLLLLLSAVVSLISGLVAITLFPRRIG